MSHRRCTVEHCGNVRWALDWCHKHHLRNKQARTPEYFERLAEAEQRHAPQHGTRSRYRKGCRCDECRRAETEYRRRYRQARR